MEKSIYTLGMETIASWLDFLEIDYSKHFSNLPDPKKAGFDLLDGKISPHEFLDAHEKWQICFSKLRGGNKIEAIFAALSLFIFNLKKDFDQYSLDKYYYDFMCVVAKLAELHNTRRTEILLLGFLKNDGFLKNKAKPKLNLTSEGKINWPSDQHEAFILYLRILTSDANKVELDYNRYFPTLPNPIRFAENFIENNINKDDFLLALEVWKKFIKADMVKNTDPVISRMAKIALSILFIYDISMIDKSKEFFCLSIYIYVMLKNDIEILQ